MKTENEMEYKCTKPNQQPYPRTLVQKKIKMFMLNTVDATCETI
jgi:hypothetical protein